MESTWGLILAILSSIAWLGQLVYAVSPGLGARLGVGESESVVDPVFYVDARGEAIWDAMVLWTLPVAGILLWQGYPLWVYPGLVGAGSYLYFAGRNLLTRWMMQKRGIRIGTTTNVVVGYLFLSLWGLSAVITLLLAIGAR